MFERYTEKARRVIFFGRYEASQFGSLCIETEHLLLGLFREDKALANRFLKSSATLESIRKQIEQHSGLRERVSTSVDLPLSHESKRVLAFAMEEAERLGHKHIGTEHMLLGILREKCFAADLLHERGLRLSGVRDEVDRAVAADNSAAAARDASPERIRRKLAAFFLARQKQGDITVVERPAIGAHIPAFGIYLGDPIEITGRILHQESAAAPSGEPSEKQPSNPREEIAVLRDQIRLIISRMEESIAKHEFEKARFYSDEERKLRQALLELGKEYALDDKPPVPPFLCIDLISSADTLPVLQQRLQAFFDADIACVWLIDPTGRRTYTATRDEGLRECKGDMLRARDIEIPLKEIFE